MGRSILFFPPKNPIDKMKLFGLLLGGLSAVSLPEPEVKCCKDTTTTVSGRTCQSWNTNSPHEITHNPTESDNNQCQHADQNDPRPFCYTIDPLKTWEYCDCEKCVFQGPQARTGGWFDSPNYDMYSPGLWHYSPAGDTMRRGQAGRNRY